MPHPRSRRPAKRFFKHETLESRHMMSGDGLGVGLATADDTFQTAAEASTQATNFESLEALRQWITTQAIERHGELFGTTQTRPGWRNWCYACDVDGFGDGIQVFPMSLNRSADDLASFSETNTQVAGVDEADLIETDGEFVYLLSGKELIIVDARDPDDLQIASRVALEDQPTGMYLDGDRLTLVSSSQARYAQAGFLITDDLLWGGYQQTPPTVTVTVLDLTDRSAPTQVEQTEIDGTLLSSRLVDGQLRLVTQQNANRYLPSPNYTTKAKEVAVEGSTTSTPQVSTAQSLTIAGDALIDRYYLPRDYEYTYETLDEYVDRVVAQWTPGYRTLSADGEVIESGFIIDPTEIEIPGADDVQAWNYGGENHATVMTFDVTDQAAGPSDKLTLAPGYGVNLHGTADGLYVLANGRTWGLTDHMKVPHLNLTKLSFGEDGKITNDATGQVEGTLLNQFAADEHDGYLRLVTATNWGRDQQLTVLEQVGNKLVEVGAVGSLAPGETIYSVRFMGDEAYVVTFRRVDPLFAIDLTDPTNPTVDGELKIPGFSNYLHPIGQDHLLGLGRGADEATGRFEEVQISIFDVTSLNNPQLAHRYSVDGGRSTTSTAISNGWFNAGNDHHAVSFFEEQGILALPIHNQGELRSWLATNQSDTPGLQPGEGGLLVMSIDVIAGISEVALIEHETPIQRSLRIGDALIAVSSGQISTHDFDDLDGELDRLDLAAANATRPRAYIPAQRESLPALRETLPADTAGSTGVAGGTSSTTETAETETSTATRVPFVPTARESLAGRSASRPFARTTFTPAARDAALLLIDQAMATEEDSEVSASFDNGSEADSDGKTSAKPTERGVRSAWRPVVRGV